ncbi:MAG: YncE family protein, partial [Bacteroidales bacterium]
VQDLSFSQDKGYIVVNNSKKVEIVDKSTFESADVMNSISYPRQFLAIDQDKGYLTNGSSSDGSKGEVLIIDLKDHIITDTIEVGKGPEDMVKVDNKVFVSNSGGWSSDNTVSIIDISSDKVIETVEVEDTPRDMVKDKNNNVWVFCNGPYTQDEGFTNSKLVKINNSSSDYQTSTFDIGKISTNGYYLLAIGTDKETLYFVGEEGVYEMNISDSNAPTEPIIDRIPYGLDVNPENGNIYCMVPKTDAKGYLLRFNEDHTLKDSIQVGYNPNAVVFE